MKVANIDVLETVEKAKKLLEAEKKISPALRIAIELLFNIIMLMVPRLGTNSKNSSKPPSADPNREKKKKSKAEKNQGGQNGHSGKYLEPVSNPDEIIEIKHDRNLFPEDKYAIVGYEARQVFNIKIKKVVTEYRAEVIQDQNGKKHTMAFPEEVTQKVQYGISVKSHAVYMSEYQLLPYLRVADYFASQLSLPISTGSIFNFNKEAYKLLEGFDRIAKERLINSEKIHADETGVNVNGKRLWLHNASNDLWVYFYPHEKRGKEAMDEINILPQFRGLLCHDHWKPYYRYTNCQHSLCNAHHLRELEKVVEDYNHEWAGKLQELLLAINDATNEAGGKLEKEVADSYRKKYREILAKGKQESPEPPPKEGKKQGKIKKEPHRNLIKRLRAYEDDVLRFMEVELVPFTNNQGERDIRMTKVHQKISGCFRSIEGAKIFCRVRSYLLTSQKHGLTPAEALTILFSGKLPTFCDQR